MADLLSGAEPPITLADQIKCVEREIRLREKAYPRWIQVKRITQGDADRELATMRAVLATLKGTKP